MARRAEIVFLNHNGFVHYGCGLTAPESWTNFDASPTLRIQRIPLLGALVTRGRPQFPKSIYYGDIVKGLPVKPSSCEAIYCSHVLEHLSLEDFRSALRHTYEYLKPGGIFRCVLPDLEEMARAYLSSTREQPAVQFMEETLLGWHQRRRGLNSLLGDLLGNSRHMWMWDERSLIFELRQAGFVDMRRAAFGDSAEPRFREVEHQIRWDGCLGIECRKGQPNHSLQSAEAANSLPA